MRTYLMLALILVAPVVFGDWTWTSIAELPPSPGHDSQPGLAGPFAGVHNDVLIIGGGANFPDAPPWEGGEKVYYDDIFVLKKTPDGSYVWHDQTFKLPGKIAYGVSITTTNGLVCIGGESRIDGATRYRKKVFALSWDAQNEKILVGKVLMAPGYQRDEILALPDLPIGTTAAGGVLLNDRLYLAGGMTPAGYSRDMWTLRLNRRIHPKGSLSGSPGGFAWRKAATWRGPARSHCMITHQNDGVHDCLLVFSGRNQDKNGQWNLLTDFMKYNTHTRTWLQMNDIRMPGESARCVMAGTAISDEGYRIHLIGGDRGETFMQLNQTIPAAIEAARAAGDEATAKEGEAHQTNLLKNHPGFGNRLISYHLLLDNWEETGTFPETLPVTTTAVRWGKEVILPSGEIRPGVRTPKIWKGRFEE